MTTFDALIFDIEIKKAVPQPNEARLDGIDYCEGWHDKTNMGVACIGAYDTLHQRTHLFMDDNIGDFFALAERRAWLVSFNGLAFDNAVIDACHPGEFTRGEDKHYDILVQMWQAAGLGPVYQSDQLHGNFGLDKTCAANFGLGKTGHGALAPVDYQRGRYGNLIDYCLMDVHLTRLLLERILTMGGLLDPRDPTHFLKMDAPA